MGAKCFVEIEYDTGWSGWAVFALLSDLPKRRHAGNQFQLGRPGKRGFLSDKFDGVALRLKSPNVLFHNISDSSHDKQPQLYPCLRSRL